MRSVFFDRLSLGEAGMMVSAFYASLRYEESMQQKAVNTEHQACQQKANAEQNK